MERKSRAATLIEKIDGMRAQTKKGKALERLREALDEITELKKLSPRG